jgi:hypothetical protein
MEILDIMKIINVKQLTHLARSKEFVSELSTVGLVGKEFTVKNDQTGNTVDFVYSHTVMTAEQEYERVVYVVKDECVAKNPRLAGYKVILFND